MIATPPSRRSLISLFAAPIIAPAIVAGRRPTIASDSPLASATLPASDYQAHLLFNFPLEPARNIGNKDLRRILETIVKPSEQHYTVKTDARGSAMAYTAATCEPAFMISHCSFDEFNFHYSIQCMPNEPVDAHLERSLPIAHSIEDALAQGNPHKRTGLARLSYELPFEEAHRPSRDQARIICQRLAQHEKFGEISVLRDEGIGDEYAISVMPKKADLVVQSIVIYAGHDKRHTHTTLSVAFYGPMDTVNADYRAERFKSVRPLYTKALAEARELHPAPKQ